jgi:microtubule-associated protein-like 1/2
LDYKAKVVAFSPDDKFLAVGCVNGFVLILNPNNFSLIQTLKDRQKEISEIKFSPDSELLAVGAHDAEIFVYAVKKSFKVQAKMKGHHNYSS